MNETNGPYHLSIGDCGSTLFVENKNACWIPIAHFWDSAVAHQVASLLTFKPDMHEPDENKRKVDQMSRALASAQQRASNLSAELGGFRRRHQDMQREIIAIKARAEAAEAKLAGKARR